MSSSFCMLIKFSRLYKMMQADVSGVSNMGFPTEHSFWRLPMARRAGWRSCLSTLQADRQLNPVFPRVRSVMSPWSVIGRVRSRLPAEWHKKMERLGRAWKCLRWHPTLARDCKTELGGLCSPPPELWWRISQCRPSHRRRSPHSLAA